MANVNTIQSFYYNSAGFYPQIAKMVNPTSTAVVFTLNANSLVSGLGGTAAAAILQCSSASAFGGPGASPVNSQWDNGRPFRVRASGSCASNTTTNLTLALYQVPSAIVSAGTATVLTNNNAITGATTGTKAMTSNTSNFQVNFDFNWSSATGLLSGTVGGYVASTLITAAAITPLSVTADTELNFVLTALYGASNAANIVILEEFSLEQA